MIILKAERIFYITQAKEDLNSNMIILKELYLRKIIKTISNLNSNMIILKVIAKILTLV